MGYWAAFSALGMTMGPLLGGPLYELDSWKSTDFALSAPDGIFSRKVHQDYIRIPPCV